MKYVTKRNFIYLFLTFLTISETAQYLLSLNKNPQKSYKNIGYKYSFLPYCALYMLEICVCFLKIFVDKVTNARLRVYNNRTRL